MTAYGGGGQGLYKPPPLNEIFGYGPGYGGQYFSGPLSMTVPRQLLVMLSDEPMNAGRKRFPHRQSRVRRTWWCMEPT